jgi:uncharacterized protein (TIGR02118 family)
MIRLTVMYPDAEDAYFDMDYYLNKHIAMVKEVCGDAVKECSVEQGLGGLGPGAPAPYRVIARICLDSVEDLEKYVAPHDPEFIADVPNFTNIIPIIQINEVVM